MEWREISTEIIDVCSSLAQLAGRSDFHPDCLIVKRFIGTQSVPLHLNHNQFHSEFIAILSADSTSRLLLYSPAEKYLFKSPICVGGRTRLESLLSCTSRAHKRNSLFLLTTLRPEGFHCDCHGEFCFEHILASPDHHAEFQTHFVDEVHSCGQLHRRPTPPSRIMWPPPPPSSSSR